MDPIWDYIIDGSLPDDPKEAAKIRARSAKFTNHKGSLYKRGFFTPILKYSWELAQPIRATGQNGSGQFDSYFFGPAFDQPSPARCGLRLKWAKTGQNFKKC